MPDTIMPPTQQQSVATDPPPRPKGKLDIIAAIKKLIDKEGAVIPESELIALLNKIQVKDMPGVTDMKMGDFIKSLALQQVQPTEDNQTIIALPRGKHYVITSTFKGWVDFNDKLFKNIIDNFNSAALSKPYIDKNHERDASYGIIENPQIIPEGLSIDFKLNKYGLELVREGVYNYISPTITDFQDGTGKIVKDWLATISLVNSPALLGAIAPLKEQLNLSLKLEERKKRKMDLTKLIELSVKFGKPLNLAGEINPETVMSIMPEIIDLVTKLNDTITKLQGDVAASDKKAADATKAADAVNAQMAAEITKQRKIECEAVITKAVKDGVFVATESYLELKRAAFMADPDSVKNEIDILSKSRGIAGGQFTGAGAGDGLELSAEDRAIALSAGLTTQEELKKFKLTMGGK